MEVRRLSLLTIIIAAALYVAPLLLDAPLTDPDEGLHAAISQQMVARGEFIVPRFLGSAFYDKPILFFWTQAASIAAFGSTTWAARLPGALFALLGIWTTGWLAGVLLESATGFALQTNGLVAATCYATMALPFMLAQVPVHDIALVPFVNLALGWLWRARVKPVVWSLEAIFAGIALGFSILTKGLEGVAIVGAAYGLYLLLSRALTRRLVLQGAVVLAIAMLVALPWYLAMNAREPAYLRYYFVDRHLLGFATDTQRHGERPWWYYVPIVLGGAFPWILWLRGTALQGLSRRDVNSSSLLLWAWPLATLALLSVAGSKAITYLLPAMPALAILAAASMSNLRAWRIVAVSTAATYVVVLFAIGPSQARLHSARDLADYFNAGNRVPATVYTMDDRLSFVYYLKPELREGLRDDQVQSLLIEQLAALNPFPRNAVLALPADLAGERVAQIPALAPGSWQKAGRYVIVSAGSSGDRTASPAARR